MPSGSVDIGRISILGNLYYCTPSANLDNPRQSSTIDIPRQSSTILDNPRQSSTILDPRQPSTTLDNPRQPIYPTPLEPSRLGSRASIDHLSSSFVRSFFHCFLRKYLVANVNSCSGILNKTYISFHQTICDSGNGRTRSFQRFALGKENELVWGVDIIIFSYILNNFQPHVCPFLSTDVRTANNQIYHFLPVFPSRQEHPSKAKTPPSFHGKSEPSSAMHTGSLRVDVSMRKHHVRKVKLTLLK